MWLHICNCTNFAPNVVAKVYNNYWQYMIDMSDYLNLPITRSMLILPLAIPIPFYTL